MKRKSFKKTLVCFGLALTVTVGAQGTGTLASSLTKDAGLAGISLTLDKYYDMEESKPVVAEIEVQTKDAEPKTRVMENQAKSEEVKATVNPTKEVKDAVTTVKAVATEEAKEAAKKDEKKAEKKKSKYANVGISIANDYVNVRKKPNTDSEILGKLYKGSAATILGRKGEWVKIKSGKVSGYINSSFLAIGLDAEELEDKYATKWATVNTTTLKVREKRSTESACLTMIPFGETYEVIKEHDKWVKVVVDEGDEDSKGTAGYVSKDYVTITAKFEHAKSIAEEQAELKRKEEAARALAEQQRQEELKKQEELRRQQAAQQQSSSSSSSSSNRRPSSSSSSSGSSSSSSSSSSRPSSSSSSSSSSSRPSSGSGTGSQIASFAQKFVGNPYVWGGTSLTNGADCSGFVQSVYKNFGYSLPRTSGSQSGAGRSISVGSLQPGDLVFYASNGNVNHVAIYIGGGRVCHASNKKTGITTSNLYYRQPHSARRIVG